MKINHNIPAIRTLNELNKVNNKAADSMLRLSSGLRINSAADDAAGMAIANKMDAQIKGLRQANRNTMDGVSMVQTAEGALNEVHAILQRMRELSVQASNGTYSEDDLGKIQQEINELTEEINRIGETTEFNTKPLLKGLDDKTNLFINELQLEGGEEGPPAVGATGVLTLRTPMSEEDVKALEGKKISIEPSGEEITFSKQEIEAILLNAQGNGEYTQEVAKELANKMQNIVGIKSATAVNGTIELEANEGDKGNNIKVQNGGRDREIEVLLQVGANKGQIMEVAIGDMRADALGLTGLPGQEGYSIEANVGDGKSTLPTRAAIDVTKQENANQAITKFDVAISKVSDQRSKLGAVQNRLEHTTNNLSVSEENLTASMSRIQDADMAYEMAQYTQQNVISQAATAMLAQANQRPQQVLQLLQR